MGLLGRGVSKPGEPGVSASLITVNDAWRFGEAHIIFDKSARACLTMWPQS